MRRVKPQATPSKASGVARIVGHPFGKEAVARHLSATHVAGTHRHQNALFRMVRVRLAELGAAKKWMATAKAAD